ncbi:RING/U-box superfamily protein [Raphanus sativus]|uniref:Uncharacterized protein LOC130508306 n=1 Tax=Raphanus sativus TaxID=3726 RepID=A0A9W3D780_RAPSA|nr:uncharacterized protein LOC130508306 [Raphanus sativus]XP_056859720.1 uncharacterized protein LOC130508306 [Raphanus sativus]XP_056859721.1 uncharacterized protein LOC130508306 [Raphanus sativus]KAJ4914036.1 RING/U-box superfamily protein [Raphanus sativus]
MGNACCVAARDKMVLLVPNSETDERRRRHSPTWSFRWDNNRGRVAGEVSSSSLTCFSDALTRNNDASQLKFESPFLSSQPSPFDSFQTQTSSQKSPAADLSFPNNSSMHTLFQQKENDSTQPVAPSYPSPSQTSSFPASPLSPQSHFHPASSSSLKLTQRPRISEQVTDTQIYGMNSLSRSSATEERQGTPLRYDSSQSGPSECWSLQPFSEVMSSSRTNDPNDCFALDPDKIDHHGNRISNQHQRTCGACSRPLSEKSLWSSQKIFMTNELSVSAILACGHVYHGECLEQMTSEIDKFDPPCPICTLGEKKTAKLSEKALKVEMDLKARYNKRLRNRVRDSGFDCDDFVMYDHRHMAAAAADKSPELVSSSSVKGYSSKPFLARHFSFGSRGNSKENLAFKKKGFFWTKSSKI